MELKLAVLRDTEGGTNVTVDCVPYSIGRCKTANFIIAHVNVSRNHCQLMLNGILWEIHDFSSSGTYVNNDLVGKGKCKILNKGDVIRFGPLESNLTWSFYPVNSIKCNKSTALNEFNTIEKDSQEIFELCKQKSSLEKKISHNKVLYLTMKSKDSKIKEDCKHFLMNVEKKLEVAKDNNVFSIDAKLLFNDQKRKIYEEIDNQLTKYKGKLAENDFNWLEIVKQKKNSEVPQGNMFHENTEFETSHLQEKSLNYEKVINVENQELENWLIKHEDEKKRLMDKIEEMEEAQKILSEKLTETNNIYLADKRSLEQKLMEKEEKVKMQVQEHLNSLRKAKEEIEENLKTQIASKENEKTQKLMKELEEVRNVLNRMEGKNSELEMKLAEASSSRSEALQLKSNLLESVTDVMESELQCTICSELFVVAVTLSCTHTFCKHCISQWKKKQKTCPICRKRITNETRSLVVDNYIDKMVENLSGELKKRREDIIAERNELTIPVKKSRYQKSAN